jgi:hypothetical protein
MTADGDPMLDADGKPVTLLGCPLVFSSKVPPMRDVQLRELSWDLLEDLLQHAIHWMNQNYPSRNPFYD